MLQHYIPAYKEAQFNQVQSTLVVSKSKEPSETLRPDFTSKLVHVLAFGTPKFYIAPYDKIKHELVSLSSNSDVKSGLRDIRTSTYQVCRIEENTKSNDQISKFEHVI